MTHEISDNSVPSLWAMMEQYAEQLTDVKTSADETKGIATVAGKRDGRQIFVKIQEGDIGKQRLFTEYKSFPRKSDYKGEVIRLRREGYKQADIANMLGISQSLVSKLLKQ